MSQGSAKKANEGDHLVARNRRASFNFELGDHYEAGLVLIGSETRSLRQSPADLTDAWVDIDQRDEAWVKGMRVPRLNHAAFGHEEQRARKLLLNKKEIEHLRTAVEREGMTVVVTKCYFKNNRAKLEIAVARGKKQHDKRQTLRERDEVKETRQAIREGKWRRH